MRRPMRIRSLHTVIAFAICSCVAVEARQTHSADSAPLRRELSELARRAQEFPEKDFTYQTWNQMRFALEAANRAIKQADATPAQLSATLVSLKASVEALARRPIVPNSNPSLGLSASVFATTRTGPANSFALRWATSEPGDRYVLERAASEAGPFEQIYEGSGRSFDDDGLKEGTYFYRLTSYRGESSQRSSLVHVSTMPIPAGTTEFSNQVDPDGDLPHEPLKVGDTYYSFKTVYEDRKLSHVVQRTSADGKTWTDGPIVMDRNSHPDLADCKFEAGTFFYDKKRDQIVWWCHWELSGGRYGDGKAMVASAKPGQPFTVHRIYNPLGVQVRDMSIFVDEDDQAYLVAASNVPGQGANATLYIFRLNEMYDDVVEIVAKLVEGGYREAPHIVKRDGFYYFFFSQAAGWYPSRGGYCSAKSIAGPWSEPRTIGNPSTFSSQSGPVVEFGFGAPKPLVMMGNRWIRGQGTSRFSALPIQLSDGFAFYDYAPALLLDPAKSVIVPLQMGRLLSQDRPCESSIAPKPGNEVGKAFDGDYETAFASDQKQWPFTLTTDLGSVSYVRNVQISWFLHKGSEAFYTYTIDGSSDGKEWKTLLDRADSSNAELAKTYGFTSDVLPEGSAARFVRITVKNAHLHNNPNNWYPPTVYEVKVFGEPRP